MISSNRNFFGTGRGRHIPQAVRDRIDKVLERFNDVQFCNPKLPDGYRYWFEGPNRGDPFDRQLSQQVMQAIADAGIKI